MRSMTLQPKAFSRLRCCAGDSAQSMTTRSIVFGLHLGGDRFDLALADKGRRPDRVQRNAFGAHDLEIDGARQADRLFAPRLGTAQRVVRFPREHLGTDDQRARGRTRRSRSSLASARRSRGQRGSSSTASNMVIGLAGMIVEIACL